MIKEIIVATNNKNKIRELKKAIEKFGISIKSQSECGIDIDVEETGTTFEENACIKAKAVYDILNKPVIADDSGIMIDSLNGMPGVYSHRFAGENATDKDRINKVLELMKDVPDEKRTARFVCNICFIDEKGEKHIFEGISEGRIAHKPCGNDGFGYDPIFICEKGKTFAEIELDEKNEISHRGRAIKKLINFLEKNINNEL